MLHSASKNHLRALRIITNPAVALKEPFNFNRENPEEYSLVERKTLRELGVDRLDFKYVQYLLICFLVFLFVCPFYFIFNSSSEEGKKLNKPLSAGSRPRGDKSYPHEWLGRTRC